MYYIHGIITLSDLIEGLYSVFSFMQSEQYSNMITQNKSTYDDIFGNINLKKYSQHVRQYKSLKVELCRNIRKLYEEYSIYVFISNELLGVINFDLTKGTMTSKLSAKKYLFIDFMLSLSIFILWCTTVIQISLYCEDFPVLESGSQKYKFKRQMNSDTSSVE